jgi:hypothetical protein
MRLLLWWVLDITLFVALGYATYGFAREIRQRIEGRR